METKNYPEIKKLTSAILGINLQASHSKTHTKLYIHLYSFCGLKLAKNKF